MRVPPLPPNIVNSDRVTSPSGPACSGEPGAALTTELVPPLLVLWCLLPNLLVLLRQKLPPAEAAAKMLAAPQLSTLLMVNIFSTLKKVVKFELLLVVPWGLVAADGEPFDIELYPPGLDAAHQLMSKEELQHMFGVDQPHLVDHTR